MQVLALVSLEQLQGLGLTPLNVILVYGLIHLLAFTKGQMSRQDSLREDWHDETRKKVEKISIEYGQAIEGLRQCELVKTQQTFQIKALEDELSDFRGCPSISCPFRPFTKSPSQECADINKKTGTK